MCGKEQNQSGLSRCPGTSYQSLHGTSWRTRASVKAVDEDYAVELYEGNFLVTEGITHHGIWMIFPEFGDSDRDPCDYSGSNRSVAAGVPRLSLNGCVGEDKNGG